MSDFFTKNTEQIANVSSIKQDSESSGRGTRKSLTKISADKAKGYAVKVWPTLKDESFEPKKNAIGIFSDFFEKRAQEEERKKQELLRLRQNQRQELIQAFYAEAQDFLETECQTVATSSVMNAGQLDEIAQNAYQDGFNQGHEDGLKQGISEGQAQGFNEGVAKGQAEGFNLGLKKGQDEGFLKGQAEGLESGNKIVLEQAQRFRELADALANPLREVDKAVTDEIAYLISRLVKVITKKEIKQNSDFLVNTIEKAIQILPDAQKGCNIHLNPDDYDVIVTTMGEDYIKSQGWDLTSDESLMTGDVIVANEASIINWKIDERIDSLLNNFLEAAYPSANAALKEEIEGSPSYDELVKQQEQKRMLKELNPTLEPQIPNQDSVELEQVEEAPSDITLNEQALEIHE